jgi:hypothetical protein
MAVWESDVFPTLEATAMTRRTTLLGTDELWRTFTPVDAVELVTATLTRRASGRVSVETSPVCRIVLGPGGTSAPGVFRRRPDFTCCARRQRWS